MPSIITSKRKLLDIGGETQRQMYGFEDKQPSLTHSDERSTLEGIYATRSVEMRAELKDEFEDISSEDDSPPMIHPCRRRQRLDIGDIGVGEQSTNVNTVNFTGDRAERYSVFESDGEESEELGEVGTKEVENLLQSSGDQELHEDKYEENRQLCRLVLHLQVPYVLVHPTEYPPWIRSRRTAIKFLESVPLTIMSQLVTTLTIENKSLRSLAGLDTAITNDDVGEAEMEEEMEPHAEEESGDMEWGIDIPMMDRATG
jgi:hypothetical protein